MKSIEGSTKPGVRSGPVGEIASIYQRRKRQILITFFLTLAIVAVATFTATAEYEAHMKILVKNQRASMGVAGGLDAQAGEVSETEINTEIELLNSADLLRNVVTLSGLAGMPGSGTAPAERRKMAIDKAVAQLERSLKITPAKKADIIEVSYTSPNPREAVKVLHQLASAYLEYHLQVHASPGTRKFFLTQANHYQDELKDAERRLTDFRLKNDVVLFQEQKTEVLRRAEDANSALLATEAAVREYQSKIAEARAREAAAPSRVTTQKRTVPNQNSIQQLGTMLVELENRRTLLLSKFRPDDRTVQEVSREIADTQSALDQARTQTSSEQATDINPVHQSLELDLDKEEAEYAGLEARQKELMRQAQTYHDQLYKLADSTTEYDDLNRTEKEAEENYLLYARKAEEARIADSLDQQKISNVAIAENPVEPETPSSPNKPRNMALGALLAGFLSLGIAFSGEYLAQPFPEVEPNPQPGLGSQPDTPSLGETVRGPAELETLTALPVLMLSDMRKSRLEMQTGDQPEV